MKESELTIYIETSFQKLAYVNRYAESEFLIQNVLIWYLLLLFLGLKRIYRIFEYSFEMIERIFVRLETNIRLENNVRLETNVRLGTNVRLETNICLLLMDNYMIFVYIGGIENIYSYLNCLLLANLCLIHFVAIIILLQNGVENYFPLYLES